MDYHAQIIRRLGGKAALARSLGLEPSSVTRWHTRGIPARYWHEVARIASGLGVSLSVDDLSRTKPATVAADAA